VERVKAVEATDDRVDESLWHALADANLLGLTLPEDVGGSGRQNAPAERVGQGGLVDDPTPGGVDQASSGLQEGQPIGVDQVPGALDERNVDGDEVGAAEEVVESDQLDVELLSALLGNDRVEGDHLHLQSLGSLGHLGADVAEPDDAERLAADLDPGVLRTLPLPAADRRVGLGDPAS